LRHGVVVDKIQIAMALTKQKASVAFGRDNKTLPN